MKSAGQVIHKGVFILLLIVLLAGCGPSATPTSISPLPSPSPTLSPPTATPTEPSPAPLVLTLTLWVPEELSPYGEGEASALMAQRMVDFNQVNPELQVEVIVKKVQGRGGLWDFLRTASAAAPSVLPDLIVLDAQTLRVAAQAGLLQPLEEPLTDGLPVDRFPFASSLGEVDGQRVGEVIAAEMEHVAYRPDLYDTPPFTWTDVLSAPTSFVFPAAGRDEAVNDVTLIQYLATGGQLTDGEGNPQLEQASLAEVLGFYEQGVAVGVISPTLVLSLDDAEDCQEVFKDWRAGMAVVDSRYFWTELDVYAAPAAFPTRDGNVVTLARGWTVALVTADPQRQRQAVLLLEWLLAPDYNGPWTQSGGYLPPTLSGLQEWDVTEEERRVLEALLEGAIREPEPSIRAAVGGPMQEALEGVLEGRSSPSEAAAAAARGVRR
ncbi:MAG: extracellular solute-binding protein [Anaerolineae bacterium]